MITHTLKTIFVSREEEESRRQCINEIRRRANEADSWPPVLLFPEGNVEWKQRNSLWLILLLITSGTTTNRKALLKFKSGAFTPGVPVQPVIVKFKNRLVRQEISSVRCVLCEQHSFIPIQNAMVWAEEGMRL